MPITPDPPFPKKQGDNIRSKDWNDSVNEIIRLDNAKLNLTGGSINGSLTVSGSLGVGAPPTGRLQVDTAFNASPALLLKQSAPTWSSTTLFADFRYIRTEFAGNPTDGPFRQFNVGAGGVSIGYSNVPPYSSGDALYVNGNAGFGTATPDRPLTVQGPGGTYLNVKASNGAQEVLFGADGSGGIVSTMTNHDLQLRAGGNSTKVIIKAGGNVGIGTNDPASARLVIAGVASWNGGIGLTGNTSSGVGMYFESTAAGGHKYALLSGASGTSVGPGGFGLYDDTTNQYRLAVDASGQVGVGVTNPGFQLDVADRIRLREGPKGSAGIWLYHSGADRAFVGMASDTQVGLWGPSPGWGLLMNTTNGNVGIGTSNPFRARLEVHGSMPNNTGAYGYINIGGAGNTTSAQAGIHYSIWANQRMAAPEFNAFSDERIKNVKGRSDGAADLRTLLGLEVTDYTYRDVIEKGHGLQKKLVAQQVERVFPQAVGTQTEVVPDIYRQARADGGWVALATDLKQGERVRLISDKAEGVYEVLEVAEGRFRTDFKPEGEAVFVYGREVEDFRVLDYDAVAVLNVSATQQLKKELEALRAECAGLRGAHDALAERLRQLEGGPARVESLAGVGGGSNGNGRH